MKVAIVKLSVFAVAAALSACGGGTTSATPSVTPASSAGPITGFGSVIVNGKEYNTNNAVFDVNNESNHSQNDLSVGQIVTVDGAKDANGNFTANRVHFQAEVEGLVTAIDTGAGTLTVLGQTVQTTASTVFIRVTDLTGLKVNDPVEISGTRKGDGNIVASAVKKEPVQKNNSELHGEISALNASTKTFMIGKQVVDYSSATLTPTGASLANGVRLALKGNLDSSTNKVVASKIHVERDGDNRTTGSETELEGAVQSVASDMSSFKVNGINVIFTPDTTFQKGRTKADIVTGARVEVDGVSQSDGTVKAVRIDIDAANPKSQSGLAGVVSQVDQIAMTFSVLGVKVTVTPKTQVSSDDDDHGFKFSKLQNGDRILVGIAPRDSSVVAIKIQRQKSDQRSRDQARSAMTTFDQANGKFTVATVSVITNASTRYFVSGKSTDSNGFFAAASQKGAVVSATGAYTTADSAITATEASVLKTASDEGGEGQP